MNEQPKIKVNLIATTAGVGEDPMNAEDILIYTKATRLEQGKETRAKVKAMSLDERSKEVAYMADTIPSSWEFVSYTFEILNVTRAFTHQFVRTRTGSYAQQTMRLLEKKDFTYRIPPKLLVADKEDERGAYEACMKFIQVTYNSLVNSGVAAEDARGILPTNIHTNIIANFNLRTLSEMAKSRTGGRTQDEYREVMEMMLTEVVKEHPWAALFLFPRAGRHAKALEEWIDGLESTGKIGRDQKLAMFKHIDVMRKGGS